jgi:hypothetical protein
MCAAVADPAIGRDPDLVGSCQREDPDENKPTPYFGPVWQGLPHLHPADMTALFMSFESIEQRR